MSMEYKKDVPAKINHAFINRRVNAAFISSIRGKGKNHVDLGIIARDRVLSVLVTPNDKYKSDKESETSNLLARVLNLSGEVLIGDKALRYYLSGDEHIDMAYEWKKKHNLPFVFALFCFHQNRAYYKKIEREFLKTKVKIPQYILKNASKKVQVKPQEALKYLEHISYKLDEKAKRGLKKFYIEAKKVR
jgi:chorismate dehydratase